MDKTKHNHVFLSYAEANQDFVEALARRLQEDARLSFWFAPWHSIPGEPIQEQMEEALWQAQACAVFVSAPGGLEGWQNDQMRAAIQTRVEDVPGYGVIPVLVPGTAPPNMRDLLRFPRLHEPVEFSTPDDERAFKRLLGGMNNSLFTIFCSRRCGVRGAPWVMAMYECLISFAMWLRTSRPKPDKSRSASIRSSRPRPWRMTAPSL